MIFIPYVCCGDPSIEFTEKLVRTLAPHSDIIELGIPFSDPIADGKTIQAAANRSLANGTTIEQIFEMVARLRENGTNTNGTITDITNGTDKVVVVPFVFMTYFNIIYAYGCEMFLKRMKETGVQGLIIPDLPFGEDVEFEKLAESCGISIINLIAPNTTNERAEQILENSRNTNAPFTYLVSSAGTTGTKDGVSPESTEFVKRIRLLAGNQSDRRVPTVSSGVCAHSVTTSQIVDAASSGVSDPQFVNGNKNNNRLCVGFGISTKEQAQEYVKAGADGVIVGSKIIEIYNKHEKQQDALKEIEGFVRDLEK